MLKDGSHVDEPLNVRHAHIERESVRVSPSSMAHDKLTNVRPHTDRARRHDISASVLCLHLSLRLCLCLCLISISISASVCINSTFGHRFSLAEYTRRNATYPDFPNAHFVNPQNTLKSPLKYSQALEYSNTRLLLSSIAIVSLANSPFW